MARSRLAIDALTAWEWLQPEEHLFGAFEIAHYRPKARPNGVCVVHPKTGEEAWWPLFDETSKKLFPELMPELEAIKERMVSGLVFRRDHDHRRGRVPLPWITPRGGLDYMRATVSASLERLGSATSLASRRFATADLLKEQTPIFPMPSFAQRDATTQRGSCPRMPNALANS